MNGTPPGDGDLSGISGAGARARDDVMAMIRASLAAADPWALTRGKLRLAAADPWALMQVNLPLKGDAITIVNTMLLRDAFCGIYVIGAGKAAASMAAAVEDAFGDLIIDGLIIVKDGYRTVETSRIEIIEAAHPVPDERGAEGARRILELAAKAGSRGDPAPLEGIIARPGRAILICLVSGGGSSLLTLPADGLTLEDIQQTTTALLRSGAPIEEINTVRKHLTLASGGKVAQAAEGAMVFTLIISDVIGDDLGVIASGPTFPDYTTYRNAITVLELRGLLESVPDRVVEHLRAGEAEEKQQDLMDVFARRDAIRNDGNFYILGSNRTALEAAAATASMMGYRVFMLDEPLTGEAREAAAELVDRAIGLAAGNQQTGGSSDPEGQQEPARGICVLAGGETTVTVTGCGSGGRAQEFALAAALAIEGRDDILAFAFGTDGTDGFTDAAGAMADGTTVARAKAMGLDPARHLRDNDSFPFFSALGDLIITGPTGTNVNDIYGVMINP
ncbi:MAG: DUF4147 domain-containing protein [Actinobacteria bacterium]|nr:DUF4147 domain-containing protein [Actinomycetota bacterium]